MLNLRRRAMVDCLLAALVFGSALALAGNDFSTWSRPQMLLDSRPQSNVCSLLSRV